jgi:DNA-binding MarR family transcriptional regulator
MQNAHSRAASPFAGLTKSQRKVLADLELFSGDSDRIAIGHRKLAQTTGLSRPTVQTALEALNELQLILTRRRGPSEPSEHRLLYRGSVRIDPGQIEPLARRSSTGRAR